MLSSALHNVYIYILAWTPVHKERKKYIMKFSHRKALVAYQFFSVIRPLVTLRENFFPKSWVQVMLVLMTPVSSLLFLLYYFKNINKFPELLNSNYYFEHFFYHIFDKIFKNWFSFCRFSWWGKKEDDIHFQTNLIISILYDQTVKRHN